MIRSNNVKFGVNLDATTYVDGLRETHNPSDDGRAHPGTVWGLYDEGCSIRLRNPQAFHQPLWQTCSCQWPTCLCKTLIIIGLVFYFVLHLSREKMCTDLVNCVSLYKLLSCTSASRVFFMHGGSKHLPDSTEYARIFASF